LTSSLPSPLSGDGAPAWVCSCGLRRPVPTWAVEVDLAATPAGPVPLALQLPGAFNTANATMALAAADLLGVPARQAAGAMAALDTVAGRYATTHHGDHELRLLLAKNPAGLTEILDLLEPARSLLIAINAREADGRDTSWLWDVPLETLADRSVVATGERAADLSVRLTYAGVDHATTTDPWAAIALLPPGKVDVVANYTAFHQLLGQLRRTPAPTGGPHRRERPCGTRPGGAR
jgi:UDP-N-acetylmuramyl tripeptide synthase